VRVDLGRQVARMQAVIRCRPGSEPYAGLAVRLPAGLHLLTTRSDTPLQTQLHPHPEWSRRLDLQFIQPVTASETIELTLVQAVTPGELELLLPEPVESWPATGLPGLLTECRVGLFPAPDLQLSVRSTVADLPLHSWLTFPTEWQEGWRGTGGPFAYELDTAQPIRLELLPRSPSIDAQLEQRGELQAEQIAWTWRAEQVQCDPPQLQYTLQVDPRLTVTGVDVRNDQASVLQRWSRSGEQLTLLLTGPATPGQTIELQGQLPLTAALRDGLPTVRLEFATPQIERRVLLALPDVPVRLEAPNWVETQAEGLRVLFDAPVSPRAEWPRLELPTREEPDRPAAPTEPEGPPAVTADSPSETNEPRITDAELAELLLHETSDSWWQGRLTVWLPPGEGCWWELHWPPGAELQGLDWQGAAPPTRESPSGLAVRLPERTTAGRLVLHWRWSAPAVAPAGREWWRPVPPLPLVWPRQTRVARLLFTTSDPALENWPFGGSLRSLPGPEAVRLVRETDRRLALDPAPETVAADPLPDPLAAWLLGNARLTQTLQQTGQWNRRHAWSGRTWSRPWTALLLATAALVVWLTRRWWPRLQAQTPWAVLLLGCLTWVGLSGSAGGALLALIALPFALLTSVGPRR